MARIRTIKPEFFTSEDIVQLSPFARLLYIALWCEADRAGRMQWKPRTFKMRYFPADNVEIDALCSELIDGGLVNLYGDGLAHIPKFEMHQHINPRETPSIFPDPHASGTRHSRVSTRHSPDSDVQGGREGKVYGEDASSTHPDAAPSAPPLTDETSELALQVESGLPADENAGSSSRSQPEQPGKAARGARLSEDWRLPKAWGDWALEEQPTWNSEHVRRVSETFRDFWVAKAGRDAVKLDWEATWRNWVRKERPMQNGPSSASSSLFAGVE